MRKGRASEQRQGVVVKDHEPKPQALASISQSMSGARPSCEDDDLDESIQLCHDGVAEGGEGGAGGAGWTVCPSVLGRWVDSIRPEDGCRWWEEAGHSTVG